MVIDICTFKRSYCVQDGPKRGHRLMSIILSNLNRIYNFFTRRFLGKFAVKCILKILLHLACIATLLCETLVSAKQAIDDKLWGRVATYLRCGGVVNNQIKKVYCWVWEWKKIKIGEYLAKLQARTWYVATLPCNLSLMACFADISVSQGSTATYARCGGIFNIRLRQICYGIFQLKYL